MALADVTESSVYPSGGELTTASAAMLLPAPGLFSISTVCPRRVCSQSLKIRATMSDDPPAGNPTTQRTGRVGYSAVWADAASAANTIASNVAAATKRPRMLVGAARRPVVAIANFLSSTRGQHFTAATA